MNEKIKNLIEELQKECRKEGVTAICTVQKEGKATSMSVGNVVDIAFCLAIQNNNLDKNLPITAEALRSAGLASIKKTTGVENPKHTFVVDDLNDLPDIFERILKGDFK